MLHIAICDDDQLLCSLLEELLMKISGYIAEKIEIEVFYSGEELIRFLKEGVYYDIIYLDIELQQLNGVEVGLKIRDELHNEITQIIYISCNDSYAMKLFKVRPLHFIIKPITYQKIEEVMKTALKILQKNRETFDFQIGQTSYRLPIKEILYFESTGKKILLYSLRLNYEFYGKLSEVSKQLKRMDFLNIHKSYLINYNFIAEIEYHQVRMTNQRILPISQQNRKKIREQLSLIRGEIE
ncbi:MAG: LytTr DNA-binding protein [Herbinix sp.]|jgi:DNA-binding LytR/AlgR family response regulator|nr:LytTr DNA-binding protein [Herbinix sp.]